MTDHRGWIRGLLAAACLFAAPVMAADDTALDAYLAGMTTWSARFTQEVEDAKQRPVGSGSGKLYIVRPGRFRWESSPEGAGDAVQLLVADGRNLWFLDTDLEQATVKPLDEALARSPAMLLAGGDDLREQFTVAADGRRDGLDWVKVTPQDLQSDFVEARFGFKGRELQRLVIMDKLDQRSTLLFSDVKRNAPVDPSLTKFVLPEGVDLIGKPVAP